MKTNNKILTLFIFTLILGEILAVSFSFIPNIQPIIDVIETTSLEVEDKIEYTIVFNLKQGNFPLIINTLLIPISDFSKDKQIYIYYDENYPSSFVSKASWIGFIDHFFVEFELRGHSGIIEIVNATRLNEVMTNEYNSIVIIPSGVFPETVHSKEESIVTEFLTDGGIIVWVGDGFGVYSGKFKGNLFWPSPENPGWESQDKILGYRISYANSEYFANSSNSLTNALNLEYSGIQVGVFVNQTLAHNGLILGKTLAGRSSIASVPVGKGFVVIFGGGIGETRSVTGEDTIVRDIAKILLSQIIYSDGELISATYNRESATNQSLKISIPKEKIGSLLFIAYSLDHNSYFFSKKLLELKS